MSRIIFAPYPEIGHLNPSFKIAKTLRSRGHQIYYVGLEQYRDYVTAHDIEFIAISVDDLAAVSKEVDDLVERIRPNLFLVDVLMPDLALITHRLGIRTALLNSTLFTNMDESHRDSPLMDMAEIVLCPEAFEFPQVPRRAGRYYAEASLELERKEASFPWNKIDESKPLIYCSLGSQSHLYPRCKPLLQVVIDAFAARRQWQLVMSTGAHLKAEDFRSVPPNAILVNHAPQLAILKKASMMITHGGLGTIKECIFFGVPMIVFAFMREQPMNAARVAYHGLGVQGDARRVSVQYLLTLVNRINGSPSFRMRVTSMRKTFADLEHSGKAADIIETVLLPQAAARLNVG